MSPDPESVSLPEPPPPRPAQRDAAIEAALRRFDGVDDAPRARPATRGWSRHPQLGLALAASLLVVVGLPAAFIVLRNQGSNPAATVAASSSVAPAVTPPQAAADRAAQPSTVLESPPQPVVTAPPAQAEPRIATKEEGSPVEMPAMPVVAAAPPPPAPPPPPFPPPAPAPLAQKSADAGSQDLVVTGSRIREPSLASPSPVTVLEGRSAERDEIGVANLVKKDRAYPAFLERLQEAVRDDDPAAVVRLISFPLRVNSGGQSQIYHDAKSVRRDYQKIFTPRVRQSILDQRSDRLISRDLGVMIGNGEVWFDHVCLDAGCSRLGPVRITAINR